MRNHGGYVKPNAPIRGRLSEAATPGKGTDGTGPNDLKPVKLLWVTCWCEKDVLKVTADCVAEGRTGSCGRAECHS